MTVITDKTEGWPYPDHRCTLCGGILTFPYLEWFGSGNSIHFCKSCCQSFGRGLHADIIQIQAIAEIEAIHPDCTLIRDTQAARIKKHEEKKIADELRLLRSK